MDKFVIKKDRQKLASINRTIRFNPGYFERLINVSEKYNISFNKLVNQCVEYALNNLEE